MVDESLIVSLPNSFAGAIISPWDKEGIENFFQDMLCKGRFTEEKIINQKLLTDFKAEYERAIDEIQREFSASVISTEFFCTRASIEIPKAHGDSEQIAIDQAVITGNESTMKILGVKNGSLWNNLYELYSKSGNAKWLEEIKECLQNICRQATPTRPLTQFQSISNDNYPNTGGEYDEARIHFAEAIKLNPNYSLEYERKLLLDADPEDLEQMLDAMKKAGLK